MGEHLMETPVKLLNLDMLQSFKLCIYVTSLTSVSYELITIAQARKTLYCELN